MDEEITDKQWYKLFIPIFIFPIFILAESIIYIVYFGIIIQTPCILSIISVVLLFISIFTKRISFYIYGYYFYLTYFCISVFRAVDFLIFVWFFAQILLAIIPLSTEEKKQKELQELRKNSLLIFGISILLEIVFLISINRRAQLFNDYNQIRLRHMEAISPV